MALQSKLLRGDAKLEAAAVADSAHIFLGARGPHVGKIQQALIQLDSASIKVDLIYGPKTAAAVKAYKAARNIIDRRRQTQADDIVGILTMASLDREMLAKESVVSEPIQVKPVPPTVRPTPPSGGVRLAFKIDVDFPVFPQGNIQAVRLTPRSTGTFEIVNGASGTARCTNIVPASSDALKICFMFDPSEPSFVPATRLNPELRGPAASAPFADGGVIRLTSDSFVVKVDALQPGDAFIDASTATSATTIALEVRAPKITGLPVFPPPTKARRDSKFISAEDSEKNLTSLNGGRPIGPKGTGRKINIFGSGETPGFEDYTSTPAFSSFNKDNDGRPGTQGLVFRPWTEDKDRSVGVGNGEASDICIRNSPIFPVTINAIRRIAAPGCRLTVTGTSGGGAQFIPLLKTSFPGAKIMEEASDAIVMELP